MSALPVSRARRGARVDRTSGDQPPPRMLSDCRSCSTAIACSAEFSGSARTLPNRLSCVEDSAPLPLVTSQIENCTAVADSEPSAIDRDRGRARIASNPGFVRHRAPAVGRVGACDPAVLLQAVEAEQHPDRARGGYGDVHRIEQQPILVGARVRDEHESRGNRDRRRRCARVAELDHDVDQVHARPDLGRGLAVRRGAAADLAADVHRRRRRGRQAHHQPLEGPARHRLQRGGVGRVPVVRVAPGSVVVGPIERLRSGGARAADRQAHRELVAFERPGGVGHAIVRHRLPGGADVIALGRVGRVEVAVRADAGSVGAIPVGAEEAADGDRARRCAGHLPGGEAVAGATPRTAEGAAVQDRDLCRIAADEVVVEARVVVLDHADRAAGSAGRG